MAGHNLTIFHGATIGIRTRDLILTMDALYQLSYRGVYLLVILGYLWLMAVVLDIVHFITMYCAFRHYTKTISKIPAHL